MRRRRPEWAAAGYEESFWMEAALQLIALVVAAFLLTACASVPVPPERVARMQPVSSEIACMADCLDDGSETCATCASDCLERPNGPHVAAGE